jgi:hypothetical protein
MWLTVHWEGRRRRPGAEFPTTVFRPRMPSSHALPEKAGPILPFNWHIIGSMSIAVWIIVGSLATGLFIGLLEGIQKAWRKPTERHTP